MTTEPATDKNHAPLVERLRAISRWSFDTQPLDCSIEAAEAADEIERLRASVAVYGGEWKHSHPPSVMMTPPRKRGECAACDARPCEWDEEHCNHWGSHEQSCCHCGYDGDEATECIPSVAADDCTSPAEPSS